jgi:hypothetical protein
VSSNSAFFILSTFCSDLRRIAYFGMFRLVVLLKKFVVFKKLLFRILFSPQRVPAWSQRAVQSVFIKARDQSCTQVFGSPSENTPTNLPTDNSTYLSHGLYLQRRNLNDYWPIGARKFIAPVLLRLVKPLKLQGRYYPRLRTSIATTENYTQ